jgi:ribosomal protein S18 acetylase RimI-like enzyme
MTLNLNPHDRAILRNAGPADIRLMSQLERFTPTAAHWTKQQYADLFLHGEGDAERLILVAEEMESLVSDDSDGSQSGSEPDPEPMTMRVFLGFLAARRVAQEWELENIIIAPGALRRGLGTRLLNALLAKARETSSAWVFLEVRESNSPARSLYERAGFEQAGRRKSYYANPIEDAIIYRLNLS